MTFVLGLLVGALLMLVVWRARRARTGSTAQDTPAPPALDLVPRAQLDDALAANARLRLSLDDVRGRLTLAVHDRDAARRGERDVRAELAQVRILVAGQPS